MNFDPSKPCPYWQEPQCREHNCGQYIFIELQHPQADEIVREWMCSQVANVLVGMKIAQEVRQGARASSNVP